MDSKGQTSKSKDINVSTDWYWVVIQISQSCFGLMDKLVPLVASDRKRWYQDGIKIKFRYAGLNSDPGQIKIISSESSPIKGNNVKIEEKTLVPYGTNLFYNPVPFEFLRTYEKKPQLIVNVGDQPAVCHNMTCDFTYLTPVGEITSATYDQASKKLVIQGTNLPTNTDVCPHKSTELQCTSQPNCLW